MQTNYEKLKALLRDLFQMDQADLDFGLYRIMNAKRDEIEKFLEADLLPQVKAELARHTNLDSGAKKAELDEAVENAKRLGVNPDTVPKVLELRDELKKGGDLDALENEVFSHLYNFFRRYYHEGDFLSLRRYKEGVYAIPYEGEEVKLYWANHDQYYIKSTEYLRNYTFKLRDNRRVHFKVVEADTEADNNKPQNGKERRFILVEADPVAVENGELFIRFNYHADTRKQAELNTAAVTALLGNATLTDWLSALGELRPTEKNPGRTMLAKHLDDFTARYAFDYFIHKDLGGFFRRELDFFIKNEIMHLDDVEDEAAPKVELYLSKIKALRKIAHKVIAFLEQLETFQKKLWLKKKFVVETNYCVTLDQVPEELYPQIIENKAQIEEWKRLFAIQEIERSTVNPGFVDPLTNDFFKANPTLLLDTAFFSEDFRRSLLASSSVLKGKPDLDAALDGLLVQCDNFQGLSLLHRRYAEKVKCAYFDPPYNTGLDGFPYKDRYQHSSWLAMIRDRLALVRLFLPRNGLALVSIDENEVSRLRVLAEQVFGEDNFLTDLIWQGSSKNDQKYFSMCHEYIAVLLKDKEFLDESPERWVERKEGLDEIYAAFAKIQAQFPDDFKQQEVALKEWYSGLKPSNPAKSQAHYNRVEKRGIYFPDNISKPAKGYYYDVLHPITNQPCVKPKGGWRFVEETMKEELAADNIHFGPDHTTVPCRKSFLKETEFMSPRTVIYQDGRAATGLLRDVLGGKDYFPNPKDKDVLARLFKVSTDEAAIILDGFGGSGTTAQSVIELNREGNGHRKYLLLEMADYFDTVMRPRIERVIYSREWKDGMPVGRDGGSHFFKYIRVETYEDCLNNLELKRSKAQEDLLTQAKDFREDYTLRYMLDVETRGSASLLNIQKFTDPFSYKLKVSTGTVGETKEVNVDLVETFNWLIGLKVKHIDHIRNVRVVEGTNPQGDRVLILWRNVAEVPNDKLDEWFKTQGYNTRDQEYDLIYVNGDNNLENLRRGDQTWKVRLIEEDFHRLMWECQDV
jgi:adenine-specific DNA-methyltransferase